ncbi:MAG: hypothetical protein E7003_01070 [Eggerthellaceae bacterium]|nr:hypothetical protein [Eggerthellaceae bacterium]
MVSETAPSSNPEAPKVQALSVQALDRCTIFALTNRCGNDLSITVYGGSSYHIGAVALAQPEDDPIRQATVSVIAAYGHRDDEVARRMAKRLAGSLHCTVSASVGIHIDDASLDEIAAIVVACDQLADTIANAYENN